MPRQNRRQRSEPSSRPSGAGAVRREQWRGIDYDVRAVGSSARDYRCPGCDQLLRGVAHVVTWPSGDPDAADRRHWHTACWAARDTRGPGVMRSRSAPRH